MVNIKTYETDKKVGMNIKIERIKRSISQEKLAEMAEISSSTMGTVERGEKSASVQTLAKIADALDIKLYKLFVFED